MRASALRLAQESHLPERWMGVTVMQEGQVQLALGALRRGGAVLRPRRRAPAAARRPTSAGAWRISRVPSPASTPAGSTPAAKRLRARLRASPAGCSGELPARAAARRGVALRARRSSTASRSAFVREVIAARGLEAVRARPGRVAVADPHRHARARSAIELDGVELAFRGKVAKKPLELLQFIIASSGSDVSTATATFALWRELDGDKAKAALNVALHRLRKLLGSDDAVLLELGQLSLNTRLVWVDCLAFEQLADAAAAVARERGDGGRAPRRRSARSRLYGGPFLQRHRRPCLAARLPHAPGEQVQAHGRAARARRRRRRRRAQRPGACSSARSSSIRSPRTWRGADAAS